MKVDEITNGVLNVVNPPAGNYSNGNNAAWKRIESADQENENEINTKPGAITKEKLNKAIEVANNVFEDIDVGFRYSFDKKLNREIIEIINSKTGEKIRQFPPEEIVNMLSRMYDMLGVLIDEKF